MWEGSLWTAFQLFVLRSTSLPPEPIKSSPVHILQRICQNHWLCNYSSQQIDITTGNNNIRKFYNKRTETWSKFTREVRLVSLWIGFQCKMYFIICSVGLKLLSRNCTVHIKIKVTLMLSVLINKIERYFTDHNVSILHACFIALCWMAPIKLNFCALDNTITCSMV